MAVLEADSLSVRATSGATLVEDVSLCVERGETLLFCGGPGAGKTLLLKALKGVLGRRSDLTVTGEVHRNGRVGLVFQYPEIQLVRRTVRHDAAFGVENLGLPRDEILARVERHADLLGVTDLLDRRVDQLSRGETTKVALLGCMVTEPAVVLLDEPLSALDEPNVRLVLDAIDRLRARGTTVVVAEHDVRDLLARADRVALFEAGRLRAVGESRALAPALREAGVKLPFVTELALERGARGASVPVSIDER